VEQEVYGPKRGWAVISLDLIWKWARSWSLTAGVALLRKFYRDFPMGRPYCLIRLNGTEEQTCSLIVNCGNRTQAASAGRMSSIDSASAWQLIISLSVCKSIKIFTKKSKQKFWQIEKKISAGGCPQISCPQIFLMQLEVRLFVKRSLCRPITFLRKAKCKNKVRKWACIQQSLRSKH